MRTAWRYWAAQGDLEQLGKFTDSLWSINDARGWYHATVHLTADLLRALASTPPTAEHIRQEIVLRTSLARALLADKGYTPEVEEAYNRALQLSEAAGESDELFPVLRGLYSIYLFRSQFDKVHLVGTKIFNLAERSNDDYMRVEAHLALGTAHLFSGDIQLGLEHLDNGISYVKLDRQRSSRFRLGNYPGVACYTTSALVSWGLGYPDRALQRALAAVDLAKRINHSYSLAYALFHTGLLQCWRRATDDSLAYAQALLEVADEHGFQIWIAVGICLQGVGLTSRGQPEEGIALIQRGMDMYQGLKSPPIFWGLLRGLQAGAYGQAGRPEEGLALLEGTTKFPDIGYSGVLAADSFCLKGNLLLARSPEHPAEAETMFQLALETAREKGAAMVELRAALCLARLWSKTGKASLGRQLLGDAYAKFTEGFTTPDLQDAEALLTDLSQTKPVAEG